MEEKLFDIEMIFIQNKSENDFSIECIGRRQNSVMLNFSNVDAIEVDAKNSVEIKHSYIQMSENQSKMWNLKFSYPTAVSIKYIGKIVIEVIK